MRLFLTTFTFIIGLTCALSAQVTLTAEPDVTTVDIGEELEVSFKTIGFVDIASIQFSLSYDPNIIELSDPKEVCENMLPGDTPFINDPIPGAMLFAWFDMNNAVATFPDGTTAFKIKWTAIGEGDPNIQLSTRPLPFEIGTLSGPILSSQFDDTALDSITTQSAIPTVSQWGLFILGLLLVSLGLSTLLRSQQENKAQITAAVRH